MQPVVLCYDVENIGTFGDINALEFLGTGLDREQANLLTKMHLDRLANKFKFSAELAFPITPFVYGTGKTAKLLATKGKDLTFSNSQIERWIDKYVGKPFRSRSDKAQELFDGIQKALMVQKVQLKLQQMMLLKVLTMR